MMMKLQLVCAIFILLCTSTRKLSAFGVQREVEKDLITLETQKAEIVPEPSSGLQVLLQRAKRFSSHLPICSYCCKCCRNKGCGFCCRT